MSAVSSAEDGRRVQLPVAQVAATVCRDFDPTVERRVDGAEKLKALLLPFRGKIAIDRYEMINPLVQHDGNIAVLTFNLIDHGVRVDGVDKGLISWNATEIYRRIDGKWKIIHSHWSYIKPELK